MLDRENHFLCAAWAVPGKAAILKGTKGILSTTFGMMYPRQPTGVCKRRRLQHCGKHLTYSYVWCKPNCPWVSLAATCLKGRGFVTAGGLKYSLMGGTISGRPSPAQLKTERDQSVLHCPPLIERQARQVSCAQRQREGYPVFRRTIPRQIFTMRGVRLPQSLHQEQNRHESCCFRASAELCDLCVDWNRARKPRDASAVNSSACSDFMNANAGYTHLCHQ